MRKPPLLRGLIFAVGLMFLFRASFAEDPKVTPPRPRWVERCLELEKLEDRNDEAHVFWAIHSSTTVSCDPAPGTATPLLNSSRFGMTGGSRNHAVGAPVEVCIGERRGEGRHPDRLHAAVVYWGAPAPEEKPVPEDQEGEDDEAAGQNPTSASGERELERRTYLAMFYIHSSHEFRVIASFPVPFTDFMSSYEFNRYEAYAVRTWFERWPLIVIRSVRGGQGGGNTTFVYRVADTDRRMTCIAEITDGYGGTMAYPIERVTFDFSDLTSGAFRRFTVYKHELLQGRSEECSRTTYAWRGGNYQPTRDSVMLRTEKDWLIAPK